MQRKIIIFTWELNIVTLAATAYWLAAGSENLIVMKINEWIPAADASFQEPLVPVDDENSAEDQNADFVKIVCEGNLFDSDNGSCVSQIDDQPPDLETKSVEQSLFDALIHDPTSYAKDVRVRPERENGKVRGFRIVSFDQAGPLGQLGVIPKDILYSINGIELTGIDNALLAQQSIREQGRLSVVLARNGKTMNLNIETR